MSATIHAAFLESVARNPDRPALLVRREGRYVPITYADLSAEVDRVAAHLAALGVEKGDVIGVLSSNRPEWVMTDLACMRLGAVIVPIYPTLSPATVKYIIGESEMKMIVVENATLLSLVAQIRSELRGCWECVLIDPSGAPPDTPFRPFDALRGAPGGDATRRDAAVGDAVAGAGTAGGASVAGDAAIAGDASVTADDVATIVYTSGTTGEPKGVVLTHGNILANVRGVIDRYEVDAKDIVVSYLPLCHMLERTCGYYAILFRGGAIAYAESIATVFADVLSVRPTIMLTVPRVVEKAFEQAVSQVSRNWKLKRWLISWTIHDLNRRADLRYNGEPVPSGLRLRCAVLDRVIASQFRRISGGRLRILASGGAPLDRKIAKTYYVLGYNIVEGYGLTETSPVVSSNSVAENALGTVGKPLRGVDVRIGEDDEILVKGPNVMRGYLKKPEETAKVIDREGWLHTGDQGRFDSRGNLVITGRIKDLIVTSYGKNVPAAAIEARIAQSPFVSQVMLYGDRQKYIVALIVPYRSGIERYATEKEISAPGYEALLEDVSVRSLIEGEIAHATSDLAPYEKVKSFALLAEEFSIANGLLTPLMKLRRAQVAERYRVLIESMYEAGEGGAR